MLCKFHGCRSWEKTVEIPQLHVVEKIVDNPQIQMVQGTQTSESLGTAPVRQVAQVEIVEAVEIGAPLPAESGPPMFVKAPVLEDPVVVAYNPLLSWSTWRTYAQRDSGVECVTPAPTVAQAAPVTTLTVAPTVFPTATVPIATAHNTTETVLKTLGLRNRVRYSRRKLYRKQRRFQKVRHIDEGVVPVVWHRQAPTIQTEQKTMDVSQTPRLDRLVDVPVVTQQQLPLSQKVPKTFETSQLQFIDRSVVVPAAIQKRVTTNQTVQKPADLPQVQYNDKVVEVPLVMQRPVPIFQTVQKTT